MNLIFEEAYPMGWTLMMTVIVLAIMHNFVMVLQLQGVALSRHTNYAFCFNLVHKVNREHTKNEINLEFWTLKFIYSRCFVTPHYARVAKRSSASVLRRLAVENDLLFPRALWTLWT